MGLFRTTNGNHSLRSCAAEVSVMGDPGEGHSTGHEWCSAGCGVHAQVDAYL